MDAELCILELCQPELNLDAKALNARLTRLEEQIKSGSFVAAAKPVKQAKAQAQPEEEVWDDDRPPMPGDEDAPPDLDAPPMPAPSEAPSGFWADLCGAVRKEMRPPVSGFFVVSPNAPVQGALVGNKLELRSDIKFVLEMLDQPQILEIVSRKAGALLNRPIQAMVVDTAAKPKGNPRMDQLMKFGREHSDIVRIKK